LQIGESKYKDRLWKGSVFFIAIKIKLWIYSDVYGKISETMGEKVDFLVLCTKLIFPGAQFMVK